MQKRKLRHTTLLLLAGAAAERGVPPALIESAVREHLNSLSVRLLHHPTGQPYLTGAAAAGLHLSLSHCRGASVIALAPHPVGVDLENMLPATEAADISSLFFPAERAWLKAPHRSSDNTQNTLRLWTAKEALAKFSGRLLDQNALPDLTGYLPEQGSDWLDSPSRPKLHSHAWMTRRHPLLLTLVEPFPE